MPGDQCPLPTPSDLPEDSGLHHSWNPPTLLPGSFPSQEAWGLSLGLAVFPDLFQGHPSNLPLQTQWWTLFHGLGEEKKRWGNGQSFLKNLLC